MTEQFDMNNNIWEALEEIKKILEKTERKNSYEIGKSGNRHKIYYETIEELQSHLGALRSGGLMDDN